MLHALLTCLLLSCSVQAQGWGGGWGGWPGSDNPWSSHLDSLHSTSTTPVLTTTTQSSSSTTFASKPNTSSSPQVTSKTNPSDNGQTDSTSNSVLSTSHHSSSSATNIVVTPTSGGKTNVCSSTTTSPTVPPQSSSDTTSAPVSNATQSAQLSTDKSKILAIVGGCVAGGLMLVALAGCFIFRHFSNRREIIPFFTEKMVRSSDEMRSRYSFSPPPHSHAFRSMQSHVPLIPPPSLASADIVTKQRPIEQIPNPFASDCYSTKSDIWVDDGKSDVSEHVATTVAGPPVYTYEHGNAPTHEMDEIK